MSNPVPADRRGFPWPWRSAAFGWTVMVLLLIAGLPLYLRMPPWCDITLYDLAARNVLNGGVHYRDLFDTNPPGFLWSLAAVRTLFGWSTEALRLVDVGVVAAIVALLGRLVRRAGGTAAGVAWMAAAAALFYPFTTEYIHCQRDIWLMLPAVAVALLRVRRGQRRVPVRFRNAFVEGLILGLGAWIKPHILIPGAAVWLVSLPRLARSSPRPWLAAMLDFAGSFAGGLTALGGGVAWLVGSAAWPWFLEVFTFWNPGYLRVVSNELLGRFDVQFSYFPPWNLFQPLAILLGLGVLVRNLIVPLFASRTEAGPSPFDDAWFARTVLAALFLVWAAQALFLQRLFAYAHVPEVLLMLALFTANRVPVGFIGVVLVALTSLIVIANPIPKKPRPEWIVPHPLTDSARMARWPDCWRTGLSDREYWERRNALGFEVHCFNGIDWVQLAETCDYLRSQGVLDGELIAWHDTPHAAYLLLGNRPRFRFMHVTTIVTIGGCQYERLRDELHTAAAGNPPVRYVIADLERVFWTAVPEQRAAMGEAGPGEGDLLPPAMREWFPNICGLFPFDQPAVYRSASGRGRYVVVRLDRPITAECFIHYGLGEDVKGYNEPPCER